MSFESFRKGAKRSYGTAAMKNSIVRKGVGAIGEQLLKGKTVGDAIKGGKSLFSKGGDENSSDKLVGTSSAGYANDTVDSSVDMSNSVTDSLKAHLGEEFDKESEERKNEDPDTGDIQEGTSTALSFMDTLKAKGNPLQTEYKFQQPLGGISEKLNLKSGVSLG